MNLTGKVARDLYVHYCNLCGAISNLHNFSLSSKSEEEEEDNCEFRLVSDGEIDSEKVSRDICTCITI